MLKLKNDKKTLNILLSRMCYVNLEAEERDGSSERPLYSAEFRRYGLFKTLRAPDRVSLVGPNRNLSLFSGGGEEVFSRLKVK